MRCCDFVLGPSGVLKHMFLALLWLVCAIRTPITSQKHLEGPSIQRNVPYDTAKGPISDQEGNQNGSKVAYKEQNCTKMPNDIPSSTRSEYQILIKGYFGLFCQFRAILSSQVTTNRM